MRDSDHHRLTVVAGMPRTVARLVALLVNAEDVEALVALLDRHARDSVIVEVAGALAKLSRGSAENQRAMRPAIPTLVALLNACTAADMNVEATVLTAFTSHILTVLGNCAENPNNHKDIRDAGAIPKVVSLLGHTSALVTASALLAMRSLALSTETTQEMVRTDAKSKLTTWLLDEAYPDPDARAAAIHVLMKLLDTERRATQLSSSASDDAEAAPPPLEYFELPFVL